jgi:transcriptional regulator with XRE-family HTH domain
MPVYTDLEGDYGQFRIGASIRRARKKAGLTLAELAERVSIAAGKLSAIENDKATLDVELFLALARVLGVPHQELLPPSRTRHFHVMRRDQLEAHPGAPMDLVTRTRGNLLPYRHHLWSLAQPFVGRHIEPVAIEVEPTPDDDLWFISHNDEEFFFVLRGTVECLVKTPDGLVTERIEAGDCMYFWSYLPHCLRSAGPGTARSVHLLYSSRQPAGSELVNDHHGRIFYLLDGSHHTIVDQVARRITSLREARGMSIADLADAVNRSPRQIQAIERGETTISMQLVFDMCRVFRRPIDYFLSATVPERPYYSVLRAKDMRRGARHYRGEGVPNGSITGAKVRGLAEAFTRRSMDPVLVIFEKDHHEPIHPPTRPGQAFVYILDGSVRFTTKGEGGLAEETLYPGDCLFLDTSFPHHYTMTDFHPTKRGAEMLAVLWRPTE